MTDTSYLALDPGETIGWATFDENGRGVALGQFRYEKFLEEIEGLLHSELKAVITEDYRNYAWQKQKKWSRNNTSKVIGKIELLAELRGVKMVLQPANVFRVGLKWAATEFPSNHDISHQFSAFGHGVYYLQTQGIRPPGLALLEKMKNEKD